MFGRLTRGFVLVTTAVPEPPLPSPLPLLDGPFAARKGRNASSARWKVECIVAVPRSLRMMTKACDDGDADADRTAH